MKRVRNEHTNSKHEMMYFLEIHIEYILPNPTDTEIQENKKSNGCFQVPRDSRASSRWVWFSIFSAFFIFSLAFLALGCITALRSLTIKFSSKTILYASASNWLFGVLIFRSRAIKSHSKGIFRSLIFPPDCLCEPRLAQIPKMSPRLFIWK